MSEETITLSDEQAVAFGFEPTAAPAIVETSAPAAATEAANVTPAAEVKAETAPTEGKPAESASPKVEAPSKEGKALYTTEEIEEILKTDGVLDSSRLDANGKILQKSFQRGTTQKFEQAKKMTEEAARVRADAEAKLAEFERKQKEIENAKVFEKEAEELGQEEAERRKEIREIKEEQARLRYERDQAKQREASMQISNEFRQVASTYHIPADEDFENLILSPLVANNVMQVWRGEVPRDIGESAAYYADKLGFTNVNNLWKIIRANPENETAIKNYYFNEHIKLQAKGPTVSPSSAANVPAAPKPPVDLKDPKNAILEDVLSRFGVNGLNEINLT